MSSFAETDICNRALQMLGANAINAITDTSRNAMACNQCYDSLRVALLRMHPWNFATQFASLAALASPPNPPPTGSVWANMNTYELPADFLRLIAVSIYPVAGVASGNIISPAWLYDGTQFVLGTDYMIQNGTLITYVNSPFNIRYLYDFTNVNNMDAIFREALAALMAQEMCEQLTQSNTKFQAMAGRFKDAITEARRINAFDKPPGQSPVDDWILARL